MLKPQDGGKYLDATLGMGGHSQEILRHIGPEGLVVGLDRDPDALRAASGHIADSRLVLRQSRFSCLDAALADTGIKSLEGVLMDFGLSMVQLRGQGRGFSFMSDEPLDMRMDRTGGPTAEDLVNSLPEVELARIIYEYGEERKSRRIAKQIVNRRRRARITTTSQLADAVSAAMGRRGRIHPATRTFQALRIAVNDELEEIRRGLEAAMGVLAVGGRLVAISYHSLEDRIVKNFFRDLKTAGRALVLTKKPLRPTAEEVALNPSARSAKLRAAEVLA